MAASSGVRCATVLVAASILFSNEATVAEESAARPRLLPARERKSRRVRLWTMKLEIVTGWEVARSRLRRGYREPGKVGSRKAKSRIRRVGNPADSWAHFSSIAFENLTGLTSQVNEAPFCLYDLTGGTEVGSERIGNGARVYIFQHCRRTFPNSRKNVC